MRKIKIFTNNLQYEVNKWIEAESPKIISTSVSTTSVTSSTQIHSTLVVVYEDIDKK
jgi:hypothetical protein